MIDMTETRHDSVYNIMDANARTIIQVISRTEG